MRGEKSKSRKVQKGFGSYGVHDLLPFRETRSGRRNGSAAADRPLRRVLSALVGIDSISRAEFPPMSYNMPANEFLLW